MMQHVKEVLITLIVVAGAGFWVHSCMDQLKNRINGKLACQSACIQAGRELCKERCE